MTTLKAALSEYLRIRHAERVQFKKVGPTLEHFVEFLKERNADHVTVELAVEWAVLTTDATDRHRANRLTMVRGFAAYLRTIDPAHEVPPWGLLPSGKPRTGRPRGRLRDTTQNGTATRATPATDGRLRAALADYLRIRRAVGYKLAKDERTLRGFVEFLEACGAERVTTELALDWATLPQVGAPAYLANRLTVVRQFASYLRTIDSATEVPPGRLLRAGKRRATPYVYSDREIAALIDAAALLRYPLLVATYRMLIGLLAVSGLRVGEAIRLDLEDIDWERGLLVIRGTKFGKTRLVPLHPSAMDALEDYLQRRGRLYPCPVPSTPAVFISAAGTRLSVLSTYLGHYAGDRASVSPCDHPHIQHVNPSSTYWYLSAAPELLQLAGERLQRHLDQIGDRT
ncbi:MAG: tyrosine-type recombinase/integrase [Solirubrobacteraceae bacterium]